MKIRRIDDFEVIQYQAVYPNTELDLQTFEWVITDRYEEFDPETELTYIHVEKTYIGFEK